MPIRQTSGFLARQRTAAAESKRRSGFGNEELGHAYEARGKIFPLSFKKLESGQIVLLNDGYDLLAHRLFMKWKQLEGYPGFPDKEYVRCSAYKVDAEGHWMPTGKVCPYCILLGKDPRHVTLWAVADLRQPMDAKSNVRRPISVKRVEMDHEQVRESIWQGIEIEATKTGKSPIIQYARFAVSRSSAEKSLSCGDSWTMMDWVTPQMCERFMKEVPNWDRGWPLFTPTTAMALVEKHKKVCDEHPGKDGALGYSKEGYLRLKELFEKNNKKKDGAETAPAPADLATKLAGQAPAQPPESTRPPETLETLENLANPASVPEEPAPWDETTQPTLEDLGSLEEAGANEAPTEEDILPGEPAEGADSVDGDFDAWGKTS
jgi:hypothetical protein